VGATVPFFSREAESATLGGGATAVRLSTPTTPFSSPELEASGHAYARLTATGHYVEWTNDTGRSLTAINVRQAIPDAPAGGGLTATLDLYVDGTFRQSLALSSQQTWLYEGSGRYNENTQDPANGGPRAFWDEVHAFITGAAVAPGARIRLQKSAANTAAFYYVDVVDLETPPPPRTPPANALSITACGAIANDRAVDNSSAIQTCIDSAQAQGRSLWIPPGRFYVRTRGGLNARGLTIQGAGPWYSEIYRDMPLPNTTPLGAIFNLTSCTVRDFALDSNARSRESVDGAGGAMDTSGTGWRAENIWTQHTLSGFWASGTGGTVRSCRLNSIWGDGINLNNVSLEAGVGHDLTSTNNFIRGTGDDAHAINSVDYNDFGGGRRYYTRMANATVANNTSIAPWGGKGQSIYGGVGHVVKDNYMSDTARYIGLGVGKFGANGSDLESALVTGNVVVRCGGNGYSQQQPALHIGNGGDGHGTGTVANATVVGNIVRDALFNGIGFSAAVNARVEGNRVERPGLDGVVISPPFYETATGSATIVDNTVTGIATGRLAFLNRSSGFTATLRGNSWQTAGGNRRLAPGAIVALKAQVNGLFVAVESGGAARLVASGTSAGPAAQFTVVDAGGGAVALRAAANGLYVSTDPAGTAPLTASRASIGATESFTEVEADNGAVGLRAVASGRYVCAEGGGAQPLIANRTAVGPWETFAVGGPAEPAARR
jgi:hypothetical protein